MTQEQKLGREFPRFNALIASPSISPKYNQTPSLKNCGLRIDISLQHIKSVC